MIFKFTSEHMFGPLWEQILLLIFAQLSSDVGNKRHQS